MSVLTTEITCPHCGGVITIERPAPQRRGVLAGIPLEEMTDEQLKIEIRNAKSVLYKAQKRNAPAETILNNQARVDAAWLKRRRETQLKHLRKTLLKKTFTKKKYKMIFPTT